MADAPYTSKGVARAGLIGTLATRKEGESMLRLTAEELTSARTILGTLDNQAETLDPASRLGCLWSEWAELLRPTVAEQTVCPVGS